jgi:hypothetical protein
VGYGSGAATGSYEHALLWSGTAASAVDLNPSGLRHSWAYGVSGSQQVGYGEGAATGNYDHALLWSGTATSAVDLNPGGFDNSLAYGTNGSQQVGYGYGAATGGNLHALLWSGTAGSALDLHQFLPSGFASSYARSIDARGDVLGSAIDGLGSQHAVLWQVIPEPMTFAMLAAAFICVLPYALR